MRQMQIQVAAKLKLGLTNAKTLMSQPAEEEIQDEVMAALCAAFVAQPNLTDIQILQFQVAHPLPSSAMQRKGWEQDWEPACVAYADGRRLCALAPPAAASVPAALLDAAVADFQAFLGCDVAAQPPPPLASDWRVCFGDFCDPLSDSQGAHLVLPLLIGGVVLAAILIGIVGVGVVVRRRAQASSSSMHV